MLKTWQAHLFQKFGLIGISLLCYVVMLLHPFLAHSYIPPTAETNLQKNGSALSQVREHHSKAIAPSQNDCPVCCHAKGNPAVSFNGNPTLFLATAFYPPEQVVIFILPAQSISNRDSRAPPKA